MTDQKLAHASGRSHASASVNDSRAAMLESIAMFAILSSAIGEVRLFESSGGRRTPLLKTPLPSPRHLLPVIEQLLDTLPAPHQEYISAPLEPQAEGLFFGQLGPIAKPSALLRLGEWLNHADIQSAVLGWNEALLGALRSFGSPSESESAQAYTVFVSDESERSHDAALDIIFDTIRGTWLAELVAAPELPGQDHADSVAPLQPRGEDLAPLRGEDLDELRRNAAQFPPPEPSARVDLPSDAYLTAAAAAERLGVAKSTVTRRIAQNRLIGFRSFTRTLRIPKDQFGGSDVVPGVPEVLALFERSPGQPVDHRAAWAFLNSELFRGAPNPRPIDRLRTAAASGATSTLLSELARTKESLDRGDHF